jgi:hypothetical protein
MADLTPPELAHQRVIETDSMTLSIGSIFGDQANLAGTLLPDDSRVGARHASPAAFMDNLRLE